MPSKRGSNKSALHRICDSSPAKAVCLVSSVLGILALLLGTIFHKQPAQTVKVAAPAKVTASTAAVSSGTTPLPSTTRRTTAQSSALRKSRENPSVVVPSSTTGLVTQTSYGAQSPNVAEVAGTVDIQYGPTTVRRAEKLPENTSPMVPASSAAPSGSIIQISHGAQSPNVRGVGADVDIRYGPPAPASQEKLPGGAK